MKKLIFIAASILVLIVAAFIFTRSDTNKPPEGPYIKDSKITSFEECAAQGNPVEESYPARCSVNGQTFTQDIGNELEMADLIRIDSPRPTQVITSPLEIWGEARGSWFFEADFPVYLYDEDGKEMAVGIAQAEGEWMTEDFVPFSAAIIFNTPTTKTGRLILQKDNPSDLRDLDDELIVPVRFEE